MITYNSLACAPHPARKLSRFHRSRLVWLVLLGMILFAGGCVKKQPPQLTANQRNSPRVEQKMDVAESARSTIGTPYRFGGNSPETGFDCSGLVCWSYRQVGIDLPRRAKDQLMFGERVTRKEDLQLGDIVVFKGTRGRTGWHSGIYTGDGKFVHSPSTGKTVTEDRLDEKYYAQRFAGARRIPRDGSAAALYAKYTAELKAEAVTVRKAKKSSKSKLVASNTKSGRKGATAVKAGKSSTTPGKDKNTKSAPAAGKTKDPAPHKTDKAQAKLADKKTKPTPEIQANGQEKNRNAAKKSKKS